jgi:aminoglycoside 6-adenylyltransferase
MRSNGSTGHDRLVPNGEVAGGSHERLLCDVIAFAEQDENIRVAVVTGSVARGEAHLLSDLDIELYVTSPARLLDDDSWHARFGSVIAMEALANPGRHPTRLLYLRGAQKIDFRVAPVEALREARYGRPFSVVVDKDALAGSLQLAPTGFDPPSLQALSECLNWFAAAAIMCAKALARNELWSAKIRDWDLKTEMLRMIEWDHRSRYGWDYDTWSRGKNMNEWMDADIRARVAECWGSFDRSASAEALKASVRLFAELALRVGETITAPYFDHGAVSDEVGQILRGGR